jgi:acetyl-CoA carboxylase beta subunit
MMQDMLLPLNQVLVQRVNVLTEPVTGGVSWFHGWLV